MTDFTFLDSKIIVDGDYSHEIKDTCSFEEKLWENQDSILKSRDIIWQTKAHIVKPMAFPVVMYGYEELDHKEGWVPKN